MEIRRRRRRRARRRRARRNRDESFERISTLGGRESNM